MKMMQPVSWGEDRSLMHNATTQGQFLKELKAIGPFIIVFYYTDMWSWNFLSFVQMFFSP